MGGTISKSKTLKDEKENTITKSPLRDLWPAAIPKLPEVLENIIYSYHANHFDISKYGLPDCKSFTLFGRNADAAFYALDMGKRILQGESAIIKRIAQASPQSLCCVIEVLDPFGRMIEGTPLQLAAASGNHVLVDHLRNLLEEQEAHAQLRSQFPAGWREETEERMKRKYLIPFKKFVQQIKDANLTRKKINDFNRAITHCDAYIQEYRHAIRGDARDSVINQGLIFDPAVLIEAFNDLSDFILGCGETSIVSDVLFAIGYQSLLGASSAFLARVICNGTDNYINDRRVPENLKLLDNVPFYNVSEKKGLGCTHWVDEVGAVSSYCYFISVPYRMSTFFLKYWQNEQRKCKEYGPEEQEEITFAPSRAHLQKLTC